MKKFFTPVFLLFSFVTFSQVATLRNEAVAVNWLPVNRSYVAYYPSVLTQAIGGTIYATSTTLCGTDSSTLAFYKNANVLSFNWLKDGKLVSGAVFTTFTAKLAGTYAVKALLTDSTYVTTDAVVIVAPAQAPTPSIAPTGATSICNGTTLLLTASFINDIHWQKDGLPIASAIGQTYNASISGKYRVKYAPANTCPAYSSETNITVISNVTPSVYEDAHPQNICLGSGSYNLIASQTGVQWQKDSLNIVGAIGQQYAVKQNGVYRAVIVNANNSGCDAISNTITVTAFVNGPAVPVIKAAGATNLCNGGTVTLVSNISGVFWLKDSINISGATNQFYTATQSGTYTAQLPPTNQCATSGLSNPIVVTIGNVASAPNPPTIALVGVTTTPVCRGNPVTLTSSSSGIQWLRDGVAINGATSQNITITDNGVYKAIMPNVGGSNCTVSSNELQVAVFDAPPLPVISVVGTPTYCMGSTVTLTSNIDNVSWKKDGVAYATGKTVLVYESGVFTATYLSNSACNVQTSNAFTVAFTNGTTPPIITALGAVSFCKGGSLVLSSDKAGVLWQKDGQNIPGTTRQAITVIETGTYLAYYSNATGCVNISNKIKVASIVAGAAPVITKVGGLSGIICNNQTAVLQSDSTHIQWQKDGVDISAANFSTLTVDQTGSYRAYIPGTLTCGGTYSNSIPITVVTKPDAPIITALSNTTFCKGSNVTIASNIGGVVWQRNGVDISATTGSSIVVSDSATYSAYTISNSAVCSNSVSNSIQTMVADTLTVPNISARTTFTVCYGDSVVLQLLGSTVSYSGFQWQNNGVDVPNANRSSLVVKESGYYRLLAVGYCSSNTIISGTTTVFVSVLPVAQPIIAATTDNVCGGNVLLISSIKNVQWQKDGLDITNAQSQTYTATTTGKYTAYALATTSCNLISNTVVLNSLGSGTVAAPTITANGALTVCSGNGATLSANAGDGLQWQRNGVDIPGATYTYYTATQSGNYSAYYKNGCASSANSNLLIVSVVPTIGSAPVITASTTTICTGGSSLLSANLSGVLWQKDGVLVSNVGSTSFSATNGGNYSAVIRAVNGGCDAISNTVAIQATAPPAILPVVLLSKGSLNICSGSNSNAVLTSSIANVQWQKDGLDIPGQIATTLAVQQSGIYRAYIPGTMACGSVYSNSTTITVNPTTIPVITAASATSFCVGGNVVLSANINGVQWKINGTDSVGATNTSITATKPGAYTATYTSGGCTVASNKIVVFVLTPAPIPVIASVSQVVCSGSSSYLSSNVTSGFLQWQKDSVDIKGAIFTGYNATLAGSYRAYVPLSAQNCNISYSNTIKLGSAITPQAPIIFTKDTTTICNGNSVVLNSDSIGVLWQKDSMWVTITASTVITYNAIETGIYRAVRFANGCPAFSNNIKIKVNPSPTIPVIASFGALTFCDGGNVILASSINNTKWQRDGDSVGKGSSYTATKSGIYKAINIGTNGCNAFSNGIAVSVTKADVTPVISANGPVNFCYGSSVILTSNVSGINWQKEGKDIVNANAVNYGATQEGTYRAVFYSTSGGCTGYSNTISLFLNPQPYAPFVYRVTEKNDCDTGVVTIANTLSITPIRWQKDSVDIANATGLTYGAKQTGNYRAVIDKPGFCSSYSNSLYVKTNAVTQPLIAWDGQKFTTTSGFKGYQWYLNNTLISGATGVVYKPIVAGNYRVIAKIDTVCSVSSVAFPLLVTAVTNPVTTEAAVTQYPNPVQNVVYINVGQIPTQPVTVHFCNAIGKVLQTVTSRQQQIQLNTSSYANGLYVIEVWMNRKKLVFKVLVNR